MNIKDHPFFRSVCEDVDSKGRAGDAKIIIDSRNSRTGSSKTTLMIRLAKLFAAHYGYELQPEDFTLSHKDYLKRYALEHPGKEQVSILCLDEISGGGAADARRFMSKKNTNLARAWETSRVNRIITICTTPNYGFVDKKLRLLCDYRIACYPKPLGSGVAYKVGNTFATGDLRLRRVGGRMRWEALPDDEPFYAHLNEMKDRLNRSLLFDMDEVDGQKATLTDPKEIAKVATVKVILRMRGQGMSDRKIAPLVGIHRSTVPDWVTKYGPMAAADDQETSN